MSKDKFLEEIQSKISEVSSSLGEIESKVEGYYDELSGMISEKEENQIKDSIDREEERKTELESFIFELKLKKSHFESSLIESNKSHKWAKISIWLSAGLTLVLLYLTSQQISLIKDQVVIGAVESVYAHTEISNEVINLKKECLPLIEKENNFSLKNKFDAIFDRIDESNRTHRSLLNKLQTNITTNIYNLNNKIKKISIELKEVQDKKK